MTNFTVPYLQGYCWKFGIWAYLAIKYNSFSV